MRKKLTNLILLLNSFLYKRKNLILTSHSLSSIINLLVVIVGELFLMIVSLPMYLVSKEVAAGDKRVYKIRRIVSLFSLLVILIIWTCKLIFVVGVPLFFDTQQSFRISEKRIIEMPNQSKYVFRDIYMLKINNSLTPPQISNIVLNRGGGLYAKGKSEPNSGIVLLISRTKEASDMTIVYSGKANEKGEWVIEANDDKWSKSFGTYYAQATSYNENTGQNGKSQIIGFDVKQKIGEALISKLDIFLNCFAIIFLVLGIVSLIILI
jgi:hypothetical protein